MRRMGWGTKQTRKEARGIVLAFSRMGGSSIFSRGGEFNLSSPSPFRSPRGRRERIKFPRGAPELSLAGSDTLLVSLGFFRTAEPVRTSLIPFRHRWRRG